MEITNPTSRKLTLDDVRQLVKCIFCDYFSENKKKAILRLQSTLDDAAGRNQLFVCLNDLPADKRAGPLVDELDQCRDVDYAIAIVRLLLFVISDCRTLQDRVMMRNELSSLKIQSIFDALRSMPSSSDNAELLKQLDSFEEEKIIDGHQLTGSTPDAVDLSSHVEIFYAILKQVSRTPHEVFFLNILQHLLQIDSRETVSDCIWETVEKLVCRAKLLESKEEAEKLLRLHSNSSPSSTVAAMLDGNSNECTCCCHKNQTDSTTTEARKGPELNLKVKNVPGVPPTPPPLPPPLFLRKEAKSNKESTLSLDLISQGARIASSAADKFSTENAKKEKATNCCSQADLVSNSNTSGTASENKQLQISVINFGKLPKQKLKTFAWCKVPVAKVVNNRDNVWMKASSSFASNDFQSLDFDALEELFCQSSPPNTMERKPTTSSAAEKRSKRDSNEINLLDPKRSLNVNIFLRQYKGDMKDLVELIAVGNSTKIGLEKLRNLMKIMPDVDEIEALNTFAEDKSKLGSAEKFFLALIEIPHYRLRVESMLLKEEFSTLVDYIKPSLDVILNGAQDLKNNTALHEVMYLVLMIGNYLNSGSYGGNAVGFKMTSLWKLVEIRANKPNMTLLHFVVMEVEKKNADSLEFPKRMKYLEQASKLSIDTVAADFRNLKEKTERLSRDLKNAQSLDLMKQMNDFLEYAKREIIAMEQRLKEMEKMRVDLATFFCEDQQTFKLEDCFKIFHNFCARFSKAIDENNERKALEEKCEMRKAQLKEQQKSKAKESIVAMIRRSKTGDDEECDDLLAKSTTDQRQLNISRDLALNFDDKQQYFDDYAPLKFTRRAYNVETLPVKESDVGSLETDGKLKQRPSSTRRRFGTAISEALSSQDRDRPQRTWSDRSFFPTETHSPTNKSELVTNINASDVTAHADLINAPIRHRRSIDLASFATKRSSSSSLSSSVIECSPIFAKPFIGGARLENARNASISDLRSQTLVTNAAGLNANVAGLDANAANLEAKVFARQFEFSNKSAWRSVRQKRSQSLHVNEESKGEDLNEFLRTLEVETKSNDIVRRRYRRTYAECSAVASDGDVVEPRHSAAMLANKQIPSSIDDIVKTVERTRDELEQFALQAESGDGVSDKIKIDTRTTRFYLDANPFQKPISFNRATPISNEGCSKTMSKSEVESDNETSPRRSVSAAAASKKRDVWPSPHSYSDQSDARSTESPTESVGERDEGFETESHSTVCSVEQAQLSPHSEPKVEESEKLNSPPSPSKAPSFMTGTKASQARHSIDNGRPKLLAPPKTKSTNIGSVGGNFVKRMIETISNKTNHKSAEKTPPPTSSKKTSSKDTSPSQDTSPTHQQRTPTSISFDLKAATHVTRRASAAACASRSSSSSVSPVRKPTTNGATERKKAVCISLSANATTAKSTSTSASKERIAQMRNRLKASRETASSSDSDKGPPARRIPPRVMRNLATKSNNVSRKTSLPDKTWQRLMSPPKVTSKVTSDGERSKLTSNRANSFSSSSAYTTAPNARTSPSSAAVVEKSPSKSTKVVQQKSPPKIWR